jgi:hypothetical protein
VIVGEVPLRQTDVASAVIVAVGAANLSTLLDLLSNTEALE